MLRIEPALPMDKIDPALPMLETLPTLRMPPTLQKLRALNKLLALARPARRLTTAPDGVRPLEAWLYARRPPRCSLEFRSSCLMWAV
jgi:hypothetical protein